MQRARLAVSLALQFAAFADAVNETAPASMVPDSKARRLHAGRGESRDAMVFMIVAYWKCAADDYCGAIARP
jgi:hypothetical protein